MKTPEPRLKAFARSMRKSPSAAEKALWKLLRDRRLDGAKFRRQHPIDRYIADFACFETKLVIEIDGLSHQLEGQPEYDTHRTARLNAEGWKVLRFRDAEIVSDPGKVSRTISDALRHPSP